MQLQPIALEVLRLGGQPLDDLLLLRANREPKDLQPAVLLPKLADAPSNTEPRFAKAALVALRGCPVCWTVGLIETLAQWRKRRAEGGG